MHKEVEMSEVTVVFAGVLLLGPPRPKNPPYERPGPFYAVSPPCTRRRTVFPKQQGVYGYIPFHLPAIVTTAKPASDGRPPDHTLTQAQDEYSIWYPFRERLEFVIDGDPSGTIEYEHSDPDADVDLLSDMREIWPEVSVMPAPTTDPAADPRSMPLVHGQVFVPGGKVRSMGKPKPVVFRPPRTPFPIECEIVKEASITFTACRRIDILSTSLDTGARLDTIAFDITPQMSNTEIRIENGDPKDIYKRITVPGFDPIAEQEIIGHKADVDFELFYTILAPTEKKDLPVPIDLDLSGPLVRDCYVVMTDGRTG
jgi:hypothetical protein